MIVFEFIYCPVHVSGHSKYYRRSKDAVNGSLLRYGLAIVIAIDAGERTIPPDPTAVTCQSYTLPDWSALSLGPRAISLPLPT